MSPFASGMATIAPAFCVRVLAHVPEKSCSSARTNWQPRCAVRTVSGCRSPAVSKESKVEKLADLASQRKRGESNCLSHLVIKDACSTDYFRQLSVSHASVTPRHHEWSHRSTEKPKSGLIDPFWGQAATSALWISSCGSFSKKGPFFGQGDHLGVRFQPKTHPSARDRSTDLRTQQNRQPNRVKRPSGALASKRRNEQDVQSKKIYEYTCQSERPENKSTGQTRWEPKPFRQAFHPLVFSVLPPTASRGSGHLLTWNGNPPDPYDARIR